MLPREGKKLYLSTEGEKRTAMGIHENKLVLVTCEGTIGVEAEDEVALGIVDSEAITAEEEGCFEHCELRLFFEKVPFLHHQLLLHSSLLSTPTEYVS